MKRRLDQHERMKRLETVKRLHADPDRPSCREIANSVGMDPSWVAEQLRNMGLVPHSAALNVQTHKIGGIAGTPAAMTWGKGVRR